MIFCKFFRKYFFEWKQHPFRSTLIYLLEHFKKREGRDTDDGFTNLHCICTICQIAERCSRALSLSAYQGEQVSLANQ